MEELLERIAKLETEIEANNVLLSEVNRKLDSVASGIVECVQGLRQFQELRKALEDSPLASMFG